MDRYRKPDTYYIYEYDRYTIKYLKELEAIEKNELQAAHNEKEKSKISLRHLFSPISYHATGVMRARDRDEAIRKSISEDEEKDRLVDSTPLPKDIKCDTCNTVMVVCSHFFKSEIDVNTRILFVFECPNGHTPRKIIYPNGEQYFFPKRRCDDCGYELKTTTKKNKKCIVCTDTCTGCGKKTTDKFDLNFTKPEPISEEDRKNYCTGFIGKSTVFEDVKKIAELADIIDVREKEKAESQEFGLDKIEKPTIPNLEERLSKIIAEKGYIKFQFEKPVIGRYVVIPFSAQDPTDRSEDKSITTLSKTIKDSLLPTNWRLMATGINYRLGYLTGQLKAYEQPEDLKKIAIDIRERRK